MESIKKMLVVFIGFCLMGCDSIRTEQNAKNLEKVSEGMSWNEVVSIMGEPKEINVPPLRDSIVEIVYSSPTGMSDHYRIGISKKDSIAVYIGNGL